MTDQTRTPGEVLKAVEARNAQAEAELRALGGTTSALKKVRSLIYRCPERCAVVEVYQRPSGIVLWLDKYSLGPNKRRERLEHLAKAGLDGGPEDRRKFPGRAVYLDTSPQFAVQCDHLPLMTLTAAEVEADLQGRKRTVDLPRQS